MLTRLSLSEFKSWKETGDVRLAPITGLFGANSSGKTSLLQALLLLKQTAESADRGLALHFGDRNTLMDLGDFVSVVHGHREDGKLSVAIDWEVEPAFAVRDTAAGDHEVVTSPALGFKTTIGRLSGQNGKAPIAVSEMLYSVGQARFGMRKSPRAGAGYEVFTEALSNFTLRAPVGRPPNLPPPSKCYGFPDQVRAYYQNASFLADLELALEERLQNVYYLGPLRAYPERRYAWSGAQPSDMGQSGQAAVYAMLASAERDGKISLGKGRKKVLLQKYVAKWLKELGLIESFSVEPIASGSQIYEVTVRRSSGGPEALITDVGFGVSQVLPVLVLCFYVPIGSTIILEQPEIHLHPAVQAGLADVFVDAWKSRGVQVIVESHSEHLLRRLQRRVAEEALSPDDAALYFCAMENGVSQLTPLAMDLNGHIANWPRDFFGDEFGEIAATSKAVQQRRLREQR